MPEARAFPLLTPMRWGPVDLLFTISCKYNTPAVTWVRRRIEVASAGLQVLLQNQVSSCSRRLRSQLGLVNVKEAEDAMNRTFIAIIQA